MLGPNLTRQYIIFAFPGAHILLKWSKTMQNRSVHQFVKIRELSDQDLCPVKTIHSLINTKALFQCSPLFVPIAPPFRVVIDTTIRDALMASFSMSSVGPGPLSHSTSRFHWTTSRYMVCGDLMRYGTICRWLLCPLQWFHSCLLFSLVDWAWCLEIPTLGSFNFYCS